MQGFYDIQEIHHNDILSHVGGDTISLLCEYSSSNVMKIHLREVIRQTNTNASVQYKYQFHKIPNLCFKNHQNLLLGVCMHAT